MQALKSVRQRFIPSGEVLSLTEAFRRMTNECISIGLAQGASSLKRLSELSYRRLAGYHVPSYYKLCAISRAAGILSSRRKSIKRGFPTRNPYAVKPVLTPCYGFKVEDVQHRRQLWCEKCRRWSDRDIVAVMNQSLKGWVRFAHSKGEAVEAVKGNQTMPVIFRVDASKGCLRQQPETHQNPIWNAKLGPCKAFRTAKRFKGGRVTPR